LRIVLPFLAGYYLSYVYRAVNAVLGPTLSAEFSLSATDLGFLTGPKTSVFFMGRRPMTSNLPQSLLAGLIYT
jgi:sugar phosphate permease